MSEIFYARPDPLNSIVAGPSGLSAINTDLLSGVVSGWYDVSNFASASVMIIGSAGITAGAVTFECTNDATLAASGNSLLVGVLSSGLQVTSATIAANSVGTYAFPINTKYVRVRVSTAFAGGTVQAVLSLSQRPFNTLLLSSGITSQNADNVWYQESVAAAAAGATITGTARNCGALSSGDMRYSAFNAFALADQAGTMRLEASNDNVTWFRTTVDTAVVANTPLIMSIPVLWRYSRVVFINGGVAQTLFKLSTSYTAS